MELSMLTNQHAYLERLSLPKYFCPYSQCTYIQSGLSLFKRLNNIFSSCPTVLKSQSGWVYFSSFWWMNREPSISIFHLLLIFSFTRGSSIKHFLFFQNYDFQVHKRAKAIIMKIARITCKVHIFWEGHKLLQNLHFTFVWCSASQK